MSGYVFDCLAFTISSVAVNPMTSTWATVVVLKSGGFNFPIKYLVYFHHRDVCISNKNVNILEYVCAELFIESRFLAFKEDHCQLWSDSDIVNI